VSTSVVAGNWQNLRFSAEFDESPGKLENPATVLRPKTKNRCEQSSKRLYALAEFITRPASCLVKTA
jgi:hypothetical protein